VNRCRHRFRPHDARCRQPRDLGPTAAPHSSRSNGGTRYWRRHATRPRDTSTRAGMGAGPAPRPPDVMGPSRARDVAGAASCAHPGRDVTRVGSHDTSAPKDGTGRGEGMRWLGSASSTPHGFEHVTDMPPRASAMASGASPPAHRRPNVRADLDARRRTVRAVGGRNVACPTTRAPDRVRSATGSRVRRAAARSRRCRARTAPPAHRGSSCPRGSHTPARRRGADRGSGATDRALGRIVALHDTTP